MLIKAVAYIFDKKKVYCEILLQFKINVFYFNIL